MKDIKKKKSGGYGIILTVLFALYAFLAEKATSGLMAKIFKPSDDDTKKSRKSAISDFFASFFPKEKRLKFHRTVSGVLCNNPVQTYAQKAFDALLSWRARDYGVFLISFGIYSLLGCIVGKYFLSVNEPNILSFVLCAVCIIFSFPFLKERGSVGKFALKSSLLHFIFFDVLGIRKYDVPNEATRAPAGLALLLGMGLGLLSFITDTSFIVFTILFILLAFWILRMPEAGVVSIFFIFFLLDVKYTACAVFLTLISYILKVLQMKRTGKFDRIDFWVCLFAFIFFTAGIFSSNTSEYAIIAPFFIISFFLTKNLIRTYEWIKRCFMACIFSLVCVFLHSFVQIFTGVPDGIFQSVVFAAENGVTSVFETVDQLAMYILCMLPFAVTISYNKKSKAERHLSKFIFFSSVIALIFTVSHGAYFAAFVTLCVFLLLHSKKTFAGAVISILPVITVCSIISQFERTSLFNILKNTPSVSDAFSDSLTTALTYPIGGAGIENGRNIFAPLYTALPAELGIPCLIVFLIIIFIFFKTSISCLFFKKQNGVNAKYCYYAAAPLTAVFALLVHAFSSCVLLDLHGLLLLFMMLGMGFGVCDYISCENETLSEYIRRSE